MWIKCNACGEGFSDPQEWETHCVFKHPEFAARMKISAAVSETMNEGGSVTIEPVPTTTIVSKETTEAKPRRKRAKKGSGS